MPYPLIVRTANIFDNFSGYLLIFGLAGGTITNVLLYYLGLHNTDLRTIFFIIAAVSIFCMACLRLLQIYITIPDYRRRILLTLIYPACGILIFGGAFAIFGKMACRSIDLLVQFGCFCIPAFIFGLDCALNHRETTVFKTLDMISIFYIPFAVCGVCKLFSSNNISGKIATIGALDYMSVAYTLLLPLSFLVISTVFLPGRTFLCKVVNGKTLFSRASMIMRIGVALFFWYVILGTGTRGTIISVFGLFAFILIWTSYIRSKRLFIRSFTVFIMFVMLFVLFMFVIKSNFTSGAVSGVDLFIDKLLQGSFQTSTTQAVSQADLDKIKSIPVASYVKENTARNSSKISVANNVVTLDPSKVVMNREQMYDAAIGEFLKRPFLGIGPMGFYIKYDRYVHNLILEVLCDYGIVGALLIFGIIFSLLIRLMKSDRNKVASNTMLAMLLCLNIPLLVSSSFTIWPSFWFFIGYAGINGPGKIACQEHEKITMMDTSTVTVD